MPRSEEAKKRASENQNRKRREIAEMRRTSLMLDPKTLRTLDRKRAMTGESRVDFVRRMIEEHY